MSESMREFLDGIAERLAPPAGAQARQLAEEARHQITALYTEPQTDPFPGPFESGAVTQAWIDDVLDRRLEHERRDATRNVLLSFIKEAEDRANALRPDADALLGAYNQRLQELLSTARPLAQSLGNAATADEAIAADRAGQWKQLGELAADYRMLRDAQMALMSGDLVRASKSSDGRGEDLASDLYLANLDTVWPHWKEPHLAPFATVYPHQPQRVERREPWPTDPVQMLVWLVTTKAEPWIPTSGQLRELWVDRRDRMMPKSTSNIRPAKGARPPLTPHVGPLAEAFLRGELKTG